MGQKISGQAAAYNGANTVHTLFWFFLLQYSKPNVENRLHNKSANFSTKMDMLKKSMCAGNSRFQLKSIF